MFCERIFNDGPWNHSHFRFEFFSFFFLFYQIKCYVIVGMWFWRLWRSVIEGTLRTFSVYSHVGRQNIWASRCLCGVAFPIVHFVKMRNAKCGGLFDFLCDMQAIGSYENAFELCIIIICIWHDIQSIVNWSYANLIWLLYCSHAAAQAQAQKWK